MMATAEVTHEEVTERRKRIRLTLTEGEADLLIAILAKVGGHHEDSPRKYAARIYAALCGATRLHFGITDAWPLIRGGIGFDSYPDPKGGKRSE